MNSEKLSAGTFGIINVYWPPSPSGGDPAEVQVDGNNKIFVTGYINLPNPGDELQEVRARINRGPVSKTTGSSTSFFISSVGPCDTTAAAQPNTVEVQATYKLNGGGEETTDWLGRDFIAKTMMLKKGDKDPKAGKGGGKRGK